MTERASGPRSGPRFRAARVAAFGVVAAALASAGGTGDAAPRGSSFAVPHGHQIERQDTVVNKDEHLAQASVPAATGTPAPGAGPGFGPDELKALVPERVGAWRRRSLSPVAPGRVNVGGPSVAAKFVRAKQEATLTVGDFTGHGTPAVPAPWRGAPLERTTETGSEKTYAEGNRTVREEVTRASGLAQVTLILANGIVIGASATGVDIAQLKKLAEGVDLARAEALARGAGR